MVDDTDAARNGMTETEWLKLSPEARAWRAEHPTHAGAIRPEARPTIGGVPRDDDKPGHRPEPAAPSGAEPTPEHAEPGARVSADGLSPAGQGAQVVLTGDAQRAARGGAHGSIEANTRARDAAIEAGHVAGGTTAEAAAGAVAPGKLETVRYADGTSATGPAPLPRLSPEEQAAEQARKRDE